MLTVTNTDPRRALAQALVALAIVFAAGLAAAAATTIDWSAPAPGKALAPVGSAADAVTITQDGAIVEWVSHVGTVDTVTTVGWDQADGDTELAGAVVMRAVDAGAGTLDAGEPPARVSFSLAD